MMLSTLFPCIEWVSVRITGMPPPTVASKYSPAPLKWAASSICFQCFANTSLLDVTTVLPALSAAMMNVRAGSSPPMHSAITETSSSASTSSKFVVKMDWSSAIFVLGSSAP